MFARISLYVVAALLIAAHFLRVGNFIGVAFCVATPLLFFVRQRWSLLLLQALAYAAAGRLARDRLANCGRATGLWPALVASGPQSWLLLPPLVRWLVAFCAAGVCKRAMADAEAPAPADARRSCA